MSAAPFPGEGVGPGGRIVLRTGSRRSDSGTCRNERIYYKIAKWMHPSKRFENVEINFARKVA